MPTVKEVMADIERLGNSYNQLRSEIADDFNDDWIDKALPKIEILKSLRKAINDMENLEVKLS